MACVSKYNNFQPGLRGSCCHAPGNFLVLEAVEHAGAKIRYAVRGKKKNKKKKKQQQGADCSLFSLPPPILGSSPPWLPPEGPPLKWRWGGGGNVTGVDIVPPSRPCAPQ
ncbi:unnamed protein product [Pleuronectes platessa]|uniref:Uncharacterized protein n=1 Tax=Pleuronectes platessa TaxID=8262 RepID=A0A9N7TSP5_PLEPL|nr:unnamed protein product [Pleuronectes platessa]